MGLRVAFRGLGTIGLGVSAFELGWKLGTGIRGLWEDGDEAPATPANATATLRMVARSKGDVWAGGSGGLWTVTVRAPEDGYNLKSNHTGIEIGGWWETPGTGPGGVERNANCVYNDFTPFPAVPEGFREVVVPANAPTCVSGGPRFHYYWKPAPAHPPSETIPPGTWPATFNPGVQPELNLARQKMLDEIDRNPDDYRILRPWLDNRLGGASPDPIYDVQVRPQMCLGLSASTCRTELEAAGFMDLSAYTLDFDHAATGIAGGHVTGLYQEGQAAVVPVFDPAVVTVPEDYPVLPIGTTVPAPLPSTIAPPTQTYTLKADRRLLIITNPAPDLMPTRVLAPLPHETGDAYVQRLQAKGLLGRVMVVSDAETDLDLGPNEVIVVAPEPGTRVRTGTEVVIRTNPSSAPAPGPGPAGQCGLTPPLSAFDLSPITSTGLGSKVPFSLVPFVGTSISGLATPGAAPNVTVRVFGATADLSFLENFSDVIGLFRLVETILLWVGVAWFLYGRTIGKAG